MSVDAALCALLAGQAPPPELLLQSCRLSGFGTEIYGADEIIAAFRAQAKESPPDRRVICDRTIALFWEDRAVFADRAGEHIARIWVLGNAACLPAEPRVSVPFDPDMAQAAAAVHSDAVDQAAKHEVTQTKLLGAVEQQVRDWRDTNGEPALRTRGFVIRTVTCGDTCAALVMMSTLGCGDQRVSAMIPLALLVSPDGTVKAIYDRAAERAAKLQPWTPNIAALPNPS